jgi:hypothetical protein
VGRQDPRELCSRRRRPTVVDRLRRAAALAAGVALTATIAACGSDGGDEPGGVGAAPTTSSSASTVPPAPAPSTSPSPAALQWCNDVPPLTTDTVGTLPGSANVDDIFAGVVRTYANEHRDTFAGMWTDRDAGGTLLVAFTDDPAAHRAELATRRPQPTDAVGVDPRPPIVDDRPIGEWEQTFDVVQARFTEADLEAAQQVVNELFDDPAAGVHGSGIPTSLNRVSVHLLEPTEENAAALASRLPTDRVCIDGEPLPPDRQIFEPGDPLDVIVVRGAEGNIPPDTVVTCASHAFAIAALERAQPLADLGDADLVAEVDAFLAGPEGRFWPQDGWHVLTATAERMEMISADADGAAFLTFEATRAGWAMEGASGYGECRLKTALPAGLGDVGWQLDRRFARPTGDATEVHLRVTERGCASGQPMGDRLLGPQVVETETAVLIAFAAIAPLGDQACPGNPSTPVTVPLPSPLDDRQLRDGRVVAINVGDHLPGDD